VRLGFLGTGTISEAVVRALAPEGHEIAVSERNAGRAARLAGDFTNVTVASNQPVVDASEVVFLGLMAEIAAEVLGTLRFRADQRVVSFMAGMPLEEVAALVAPARAEAVMLPYPGIAQGGSPILALGKVAVIEALFAPANTVYSLRDRAELEAYLCAQAVLSPAVQMVSGAAEWLGGGEAFLRHLVGSSLMSGACQPMLDALNTKGGYNQRLRQHMESAGMRAVLSEGLDRLADKG